MTTLPRRYLKQNGKTDLVKVAVCQCGARARGPLGGVCGACAGAIPSVEEQRMLNDRVWEQYKRDHPGWERNLKLSDAPR